jgi:rhodanese-related sulfurtransferase
MAEITVNEADQRRSTARILDVREDFEVAEGMIPGALHIPMGQLQARLSELDPAVPVIAVCRSGNRSARGGALNATGLEEVIQAVKNLDTNKLQADTPPQHP